MRILHLGQLRQAQGGVGPVLDAQPDDAEDPADEKRSKCAHQIRLPVSAELTEPPAQGEVDSVDRRSSAGTELPAGIDVDTTVPPRHFQTCGGRGHQRR